VPKALTGRADSVKEGIFGASLFDRRSDYDTNDFPIGRLRIAEVRKRLADDDQNASDEPVMISIPYGSFRAVFEWSRTGPAQSSSVSPRAQELSQSPVQLKVQGALRQSLGMLNQPEITENMRNSRTELLGLHQVVSSPDLDHRRQCRMLTL